MQILYFNRREGLFLLFADTKHYDAERDPIFRFYVDPDVIGSCEFGSATLKVSSCKEILILWENRHHCRHKCEWALIPIISSIFLCSSRTVSVRAAWPWKICFSSRVASSSKNSSQSSSFFTWRTQNTSSGQFNTKGTRSTVTHRQKYFHLNLPPPPPSHLSRGVVPKELLPVLLLLHLEDTQLQFRSVFNTKGTSSTVTHRQKYSRLNIPPPPPIFRVASSSKNSSQSSFFTWRTHSSSSVSF